MHTVLCTSAICRALTVYIWGCLCRHCSGFFGCCDETLPKSNLPEGRVYLAGPLRSQSITEGTNLRPELKQKADGRKAQKSTAGWFTLWLRTS